MNRGVVVGVALLVSLAGSVGFALSYAIGGGTQQQGILLALGLAGLGTGLVLWGKHLLDVPTAVQERKPLAPPAEQKRDAAEQFAAGSGELTRRPLLVGLLVGAFGALMAAAAFPLRSLGPRPLPALRTTPWRAGVRVVTDDGRPVHVDRLAVGAALTVFPEGYEGDGDAQVILVRVTPDLLRPAPERAEWSPEGYLAYSQICTHAGCPVALYQRESHRLLCPCHQSAFLVLEQATPVFGPATRPLPQLPLAVDGSGFLLARSDFLEPVGPGFWSLET